MPHQPRVLLLPSPVSSGSVGTVAKALGIAHILKLRGCNVRFVMGGKLANLIRSRGFEVLPSPVPRSSVSIRPIRNIIDVIQWTGLAATDFIEQTIRAELTAIQQFKPDVIFAETRPTAAISAAAAQVPLVTIASWPTHPDFPANRDVAEQPLEVFNRELERYHLSPIQHVAELLFLRSKIAISPSLPMLEPELQAVPGVRFVGYMLDTSYEEIQLPVWYENWRRNPFIFIYLSVGAINPDLYLQTLPSTFEGLPYAALCACGFHYGLKDLPISIGNVRFMYFIPAQAVIKDASMVIFHGGQDTLLMTLLYGLPSIVIPGQHFERQYNAEQLAKQGAAKVLPVHAFRPQRLRKAMMEVIDGPYSGASKELADCLATYKGTEQGVEFILSAI